MLNSFQFLTLFAIFLRHGLVEGAKFDLPIVNELISPDGYQRSSVLAGGTFPGPVIQGTKGDRFDINVINYLYDDTMDRSTSVHWHGIFQKSTNWADGSSFVSQCPIAPNDSFLYGFSVTEQAGTFWYHSHLSTQYCDGLRGAFIIYDPDDPHKGLYDVDDESTIITLADWYHQPSPTAHKKIPPPPNSILINGKGRCPNGPAVPLAVVQVEPLKRYRLRIIAMSCDPNFTFSIDHHSLLVIEADGENTTPLLVDSLQIFAGQRYSVVLFANQPIGNYWIRSQPNMDRGTQGFDNGINSAILRYAGAPASDPQTTFLPSILPLNEVNLSPLRGKPAPGDPSAGGADIALTIQHKFDMESFSFKLNGVSWIPPTVPVLLQIISGAHSAQDLLPKGSIYPLPRNKVIELSLPGTDGTQGGPHPFHLHGHSFSVVRSAGSSVYNYDTPVRRDTVNTGGSTDNVTIRFETDNTGPWLLHCHIDWHLELGLAVVFAEDIAGSQEIPSEQWGELCPKYATLSPSQL
ncbi:laccase [Phlegmacium glaucopus]|nr:laccase [Phlegmacium glaucopus]